MSAISSRIPASVEKEIQSCLSRYANNLTSVFCQFPSPEVPPMSHTVIRSCIHAVIPPFWPQISNIINRHAMSLQKQSEHDQFFMNTNPVMQLVQELVTPYLYTTRYIVCVA